MSDSAMDAIDDAIASVRHQAPTTSAADGEPTGGRDKGSRKNGNDHTSLGSNDVSDKRAHDGKSTEGTRKKNRPSSAGGTDSVGVDAERKGRGGRSAERKTKRQSSAVGTDGVDADGVDAGRKARGGRSAERKKKRPSSAVGTDGVDGKERVGRSAERKKKRPSSAVGADGVVSVGTDAERKARGGRSAERKNARQTRQGAVGRSSSRRTGGSSRRHENRESRTRESSSRRHRASGGGGGSSSRRRRGRSESRAHRSSRRGDEDRGGGSRRDGTSSRRRRRRGRSSSSSSADSQFRERVRQQIAQAIAPPPEVGVAALAPTPVLPSPVSYGNVGAFTSQAPASYVPHVANAASALTQPPVAAPAAAAAPAHIPAINVYPGTLTVSQQLQAVSGVTVYEAPGVDLQQPQMSAIAPGPMMGGYGTMLQGKSPAQLATEKLAEIAAGMGAPQAPTQTPVPNGPDPSTKPYRELYISGFPVGITNQALVDFLNAVMDQAKLTAIPSPVLKSILGADGSFGFVELQTIEATDLCMGLAGTPIGDSKLRVGRPKNYPGPPMVAPPGVGMPPPMGVAPPGMYGAHGGMGGGGMMAPGMMGMLDSLEMNAMGSPSTVVELRNMVLDEDLESAADVKEIEQDITSECIGFGAVEEVLMPRKGDRPLAIYVRFSSSEFAFVAIKKLSGRTFSDRTIAAKYYDVDDFNNKKRTKELEALLAASTATTATTTATATATASDVGPVGTPVEAPVVDAVVVGTSVECAVVDHDESMD